MKMLVYSHDTFGLGNIRRMLAICEHLLANDPSLSILLVTGSRMIQGFRLPARLDYLKLPCLKRDDAGHFSSGLPISLEELIRLRSDLIRAAALHFQPDVVLVDKKPSGIQAELKPTLEMLREIRPQTRWVLLLRDILDCPLKTISEWRELGNDEAIQIFYDQVLVVGSPVVFDLRSAYHLSAGTAQKVRFCGYLRKEASESSPVAIRHQLGIPTDRELVLVTPGGGEDGETLIRTYLEGLRDLLENQRLYSLIVTGPEMAVPLRQSLEALAATLPHVRCLEFHDDLLGLMAAADVVVSMAGYNTICEILSLNKRAVVVPRVRPVVEQWIRAERMSALGLIRALHPDSATPARLLQQVFDQLDSPLPRVDLDLNGLPTLAQHLLGSPPPEPQILKPLYPLCLCA